MTIVEFIEARIAEDEAAARSAATSPDIWDGPGEDWIVLEFACEGLSVWNPHLHQADEIGHETDLTRHMSRHDPARVLRQCEAMRELLSRYREAEHESVLSDRDAGFEAGLSIALESIASIWSEHPDYQEEWAK